MSKTVIYSTPTCPYCIRVKKYLEDMGVSFENYDVSSDQEKLKEMMEKSKQMGVPVVEINGKVIVGFNKKKIDDEIYAMKKS